MSTNATGRRFEVFTIRDYMQDRQQKSQWTKVGVAFENQDGSWNLRLHALPLTNPKTGLAELHMRAPRPKEEKGEDTGAQQTSDGFAYAPYAPEHDESIM